MLPVLAASMMALVANAFPSTADAYSVQCHQTGIGCIASTGYNGSSVWGYPVDLQGNNCTNYAAFRLSRNGAQNPGNLGNAGDWANNARAKGFRVDQSPAVGSIAQWNYGSAYAPASGHVAYVESVSGSTITLSDSAYEGGSKRWTVSRSDVAWPDNFIHFKDVATGSVQDGTFVRASDTGNVYRIAGGAPLFINSWAPFGGPQPTVARTQSQINAMPRFPKDGTFINARDTHRVYRIAGGAPVYISSWSNVGGSKPSVAITQSGIDSGAGGHLRTYPADGTFVSAENGRVFRFAGGAPIYIANWAHVGGHQPSIRVSYSSLGNGSYGHVRTYPADGTFVSAENGRVFRFAGGAPIYIANWAHVGGHQPSIRVSYSSLGNGSYGHVRTYPADGTFLISEAGHVYRVAGGAPLYISTWGPFGSPQPTTRVSGSSILNGPYGHLLATPMDGTVLRVIPADEYWLISDGVRTRTSPTSAVSVTSSALEGIPPASPASQPGGHQGSDTVRIADVEVKKRQRLRHGQLRLMTGVSSRGARLKVIAGGKILVMPNGKRRRRSNARAARRDGTLHLTKARTSVAPHERKILRQKLKGSKRKVRKAQHTIKRALKRGRKVRATITIKLIDPAGNVKRMRRRVRLVL